MTKEYTPFVSIIVPVYNGSATIVSCVESLLAQDYPASRREIIIVDNGSKDSTVDVLRPFVQERKIKLLAETQILNSYGARNRGAASARGEILAFTDADCLASGDWLAKLLEGWDEKIGVRIGDNLLHEPETAIARYYSYSKQISLQESNSSFPGMRTSNCAIKRDCFTALGGFDTRFTSGGDSEFLERVVTTTEYTYSLSPDAVVFNKNYDGLPVIFRRHLRFGTIIDTLRDDPLRSTSFVSYASNIKGLLVSLGALVLRCLNYPFVAAGMNYRGRRVTDLPVFVVEPLIRLTEKAGLLIGRTFRLRQFR